jgi:hypothetical protein
VSAFAAALAGAITAIGVGSVTVARNWPARSGPTAPAPAPLLRPIEALDTRETWCQVEQRTTLHARLRLGGQLLCMDCRNPNTPPEEANTQ